MGKIETLKAHFSSPSCPKCGTDFKTWFAFTIHLNKSMECARYVRSLISKKVRILPRERPRSSSLQIRYIATCAGCGSRIAELKMHPYHGVQPVQKAIKLMMHEILVKHNMKCPYCGREIRYDPEAKPQFVLEFEGGGIV